MMQQSGTPAKLKTSRFQLCSNPASPSPELMIVDYIWWADNEREILNWMNEALPRGIDHQQGMVLSFDTEFDRINFLMKWGP
jgi:hypothetical protein